MTCPDDAGGAESVARLRLIASSRDIGVYKRSVARDPCSYCTAPATTIDHITATSTGGRNHWTNLAAACVDCNTRKHSMSLLAFLGHRTADARALPISVVAPLVSQDELDDLMQRAVRRAWRAVGA